MNIKAEQQLRDYFAKERGRQVSEAMREKAERGIMPGCAPIGYKNAVINGERVIVIDPETGPKVRRLFEMRDTKKMSYRKLAVEAERMGLRSRNGKTFGPSALKAILENPFYMGFLRYEGHNVRGTHQAIIPRSLFYSLGNISTYENKKSRLL